MTGSRQSLRSSRKRYIIALAFAQNWCAQPGRQGPTSYLSSDLTIGSPKSHTRVRLKAGVDMVDRLGVIDRSSEERPLEDSRRAIGRSRWARLGVKVAHDGGMKTV